MSRITRALFKKPNQAKDAIEALGDAGFTESDISLVTNENVKSSSFDISDNTKFPEGALTGGLFGALVGGLVGTGVVISGGFGVFAAGPIAVAMSAGAGAYGGTLLGGVYGTVFPEDENQYFEDQIVQGATMVAVESDQHPDKVKKIMSEFGATKISQN